MLNLIANCIDLTRAALDEVLTHLSGDVAAAHTNGHGAEVGRLPATDHRAGVTNGPGVRVPLSRQLT